MIANATVQKVIEEAQIDEVVADYVNLKKRGANMIGLCPFHNEKTPSFSVSPAKNIYKCFGCGEAGNPVGFVMGVEQISFPEAIKKLAAKYNIEIEEDALPQEVIKEKQEKEALFIINQWAESFFVEQLNTDVFQGKTIGLSYFKERGFLQKTIQEFGLGFAPDSFDALITAAKQKGFEAERLTALGLAKEKNGKVFDFFRNRAMFTIHDVNGKPIGFAGRVLKNSEHAPKYINSPESPIYHKSNALFGLFQAKHAVRKSDKCLIVEGYTDVMSLHQNGVHNVVAASGTSLTEGQIRLIRRFTENILLVFDGDKAGIKAALRGVNMVLSTGMNVDLVALPDGEDPDSYMQNVGADAFQHYLKEHAKDVILYKAALNKEKLEEGPQQWSEVVKDIVASIAVIPDHIRRFAYVRECAQLLNIKEEILEIELSDAQKQVAKTQEKEQKIDQKKQVSASELIDHNAQIGVSQSPKYSPLEAQEKNLVRVLIQYGRIVHEEETVAELILQSIQEIDFQFQPWKQMKDEFKHQVQEKSYIPTETDFFQHPSPEIQAATIHLLDDSLKISNAWEERFEVVFSKDEFQFARDIEESILRFRYYVLTDKKMQLQKQLNENSSDEHLIEIMQIQSEINEVAKFVNIRVSG